MKPLFALLLLVLLADCSAYFSAERACRRENIAYLIPFVGGFAAAIVCHGRVNDFAE